MPTATDQQLEQMKSKYASVFSVIQQQNVSLSHVHIQDGKLFIQGAAPSEEAKNKVWDQIKLVNPNWQSELVADIRTEEGQTSKPNTGQTSVNTSQDFSTQQGGTRTYTVQPGDSLSKISQQFYGSANHYMKIFEANKDKLSDPNMVKAGQVLNIPA